MSYQEALLVLDQLEQMGTKRKPKLALLEAKKDNEDLQTMFLRAYDWEETFGLRVKFFKLDDVISQRTKPLFGSAAKDTTSPWNAFNLLLNKYRDRLLTGKAAKDAWGQLALRLSDRERVWFSRIINRDLKIGIDRTTIEKVWPDLIRPFGVQLAREVIDKDGVNVMDSIPNEKDPWMQWPVLLEPKLDGMRVVIEYDPKGPTCTAFSREGHVLPYVQDIMDSLAEYLVQHLDEPFWIDTEAFYKDWNTTLSLVKKEEISAEERSKLVFHCFDMPHTLKLDERPLRVRRLMLFLLFKQTAKRKETFAGHPNFAVLTNAKAENMEELFVVYNKQLDDGHEGCMVKFLESPYRAKRTNAWLKLKPTITVDAEIVGFEAGDVATKNEHRLGAFVVRRGDTGEVCRVGGGFSDAKRDEFWQNRDELLGKIIEFKEQGARGSVAKASFPRFVRLRLDREKL